MLIGVLSDAHGNPAGFSVCLAHLLAAGVERIYYLGDSVGYMPDFAPILSRLAELDAVCLRGNHEQMLLGTLPLPERRDQVYQLGEARARLEPAQRAYIGDWHDATLQVREHGRHLAFFHGSPWRPAEGYVYPDANLAPFETLPYDTVFMGHTHRPFVARAGSVAVINVGSCGLPRDVGNLACCVIHDTCSGDTETVRLPFDVEQVIAHYGNHMHPSVIQCLRRRHGTVQGTADNRRDDE